MGRKIPARESVGTKRVDFGKIRVNPINYLTDWNLKGMSQYPFLDADMTIRPLLVLPAALALFLASCSVDEKASLVQGPAKTATSSKEKKTSPAEKSKTEAAGKAKAATAKTEAAAAKVKEEEALELAEAKSEAKEKAEKAALARKKVADKIAADTAEEKARVKALAIKTKEREAENQAKLAAKQKKEAGKMAEDKAHEVAALATETRGGGFFSMLSIGTPTKQYKSKGHDIFVNGTLLPALNPSNAKIEISLGEQRARVYRKDGDAKILVIETDISTGRSGYTTPTGTYSIGEKKVEKRSNLYGSGSGSNFVGAEMPYWMRINGGIGLHVGIVPGFPASHGCIRVPASVQPLIFSKVGVGTPVTITL